jgi:glycosyltransferase involved in cell wall biosynthesis
MNTEVVILYRVIQEWRLPIFNRLSEIFRLKVFFGPDFKGTKIVSSQKQRLFEAKEVYSLRLKGKSKNDMFAMPLSPFLIFNLILSNPQVVITEGASNLFNAITGYVYCRVFRKKFIWWSLGTLNKRVHSGFRKKLNIIINYLERRADAIITYSEMGRNYFISIGVKKERIFVATNVIDTDSKLREMEHLDVSGIYKAAHQNSDFNILYVGALTKTKKVDNLIIAFSKLEQKYRDKVKLTIIGDGNMRFDLEALAQQLRVKNIEFKGKMFDATSHFFLGADVFVLPGLGGLAVSEAMTYGLPVITGIGDGCEKDLIINWKNGVVDENLNEISIYEILEKIINEPQLLAYMKEQAKKTILEFININTYIENIVNAVNSVQKLS